MGCGGKRYVSLAGRRIEGNALSRYRRTIRVSLSGRLFEKPLTISRSDPKPILITWSGKHELG
jgi:hypothetical protein